MNLAKEIQKKIDAGQITITELSKILDVTRNTIYKRLKDDKWKRPQKEILFKLVA